MFSFSQGSRSFTDGIVSYTLSRLPNNFRFIFSVNKYFISEERAKKTVFTYFSKFPTEQDISKKKTAALQIEKKNKTLKKNYF